MDRRPTTPASIAGQLAPSDYAALKASRDLESLLESDRRGASTKAFARGFAAASASTFAIGALPEIFARGVRRGELQELEDVNRLSQYLQEARGMKPALAEANAAGVMQLMRLSPSHVYEGEAERVVADLGGVVTQDGRRYSVGAAVQGGSSVNDAARAIQHATEVGEAFPLASIRSSGPAAGTREAVLDFLRSRYKPNLPSSAGLRILARRLQPVAMGALPFGVMGGYEAYQRNQEQRRELKRLARRTS